jgi:transcriptional regulator with XRE-family HTH domain
MLFGTPHIGKAIAALRADAKYNQTQLAEALGIKKSVMNKYEKGTAARVPEEILEKIARIINREVIEIWETAFEIFRFNFFRERAQREGTDLDTLLARHDSSISAGEVNAALDAYVEKLREYEKKRNALMAREKGNRLNVRDLIVGAPKKRPRKSTSKKPAAKKDPKQ